MDSEGWQTVDFAVPTTLHTLTEAEFRIRKLGSSLDTRRQDRAKVTVSGMMVYISAGRTLDASTLIA